MARKRTGMTARHTALGNGIANIGFLVTGIKMAWPDTGRIIPAGTVVTNEQADCAALVWIRSLGRWTVNLLVNPSTGDLLYAVDVNPNLSLASITPRPEDTFIAGSEPAKIFHELGPTRWCAAKLTLLRHDALPLASNLNIVRISTRGKMSSTKS